MVKFHEHIISELLEDPAGGLVVVSTALSLAKLLSTLLPLHDPSQGTLLFLSPPASLRSRVLQNPNFPHDSTSEISTELPVHRRHSLYTSGGVCLITPRILIVDLLSVRVPLSSLAGIILPATHSLSETSTEAFIIRVLKILTLARCPGTPPLDVQELEGSPPEVVDVRVPMSKYMVGILKAIVEAMDACLKEMRKTNKVDVEDREAATGPHLAYSWEEDESV